MAFRVTPQFTVGETIRYSQGHNANLAKLQQQISSGLRVEKPSDDPGILSSLLANKATVARIDVDFQNIAAARSKLNQSVSQLTSVKLAFQEAKALNLQGVQDQERETLAQEMDGILQQVIRIANATDGQDPLYSGTSNTGHPFEVSESNVQGEATQVTYRGTLDRSVAVVGVRTSVDVLYSGAEIFQSVERSETVFVGDTGIEAGPGADSARGRGEIVLSHAFTDYGGPSGIQPGSSSIGGDTILGTHSLTVDGINNRISIDGGSPVPFTPGETDLRLVGSNGEVLYVDMSNLIIGFAGAVSVQGHGTLSVDGGLSTAPLTFVDNQAVTHADSGEVTYVDTRNVNKSGREDVEYVGSASAFEVLVNLRDDLRNTRGLSPDQWQAAMQRNIGDVQRVIDHVLNVVSEQSVSLESLDAIENQTSQHKLETVRVIADAESADIPATVVRFQAEQNALQYTYAISAQLMNTNILDFLR